MSFPRYLKGEELKPSDKVKFDFDAKNKLHTCVIEDTMTETDEGTLKIVAKNCAGEASCQAKLEVKGLAPKFIEEPLKCVILEKQTAVFKTKIIGEPTPKVSLFVLHLSFSLYIQLNTLRFLALSFHITVFNPTFNSDLVPQTPFRALGIA